MSEFLDWLTAVGTSGAFVVAAVIFFTSTRSATKDRRQAQAVLVDAWVIRVVKYADMHIVTLQVSNHSDQAVRVVNIQIYDDQLEWSATVQVVPPTVRGDFFEVPIQVPTTTDRAAMNELQLQGLYRMNLSFVDSAAAPGFVAKENFTGPGEQERFDGNERSTVSNTYFARRLPQPVSSGEGLKSWNNAFTGLF